MLRIAQNLSLQQKMAPQLIQSLQLLQMSTLELELEIKQQLDALGADQQVMLKLTLPEKANLYKPLVDHPRVMRVVALSGGYSRNDANAKLASNTGMIASFSRALTEGLSAQQSDAEFDAALAESVDSIYQASKAG